VAGSRIVTKKHQPLLQTRQQVLRQFRWVSSCHPDVGARLARMSEEVRFAGGEALCEERDTADCMYVITKGTVTVEQVIRAKTCVLARKGWGWCVGELAMLDDSSLRSATVRAAKTGVEALRIGYPGMKQVGTL
jgi:CRP-like cAMP-binding protein